MSELNDKIFKTITSNKCWDRMDFIPTLAANEIEILVLENKLELLNSIYLEHFGEGGTIMIGELELGEAIEQTEERLNQLK